MRIAIQSAKSMLSALKKGDADVLSEAVMLQGLLSGDVMTASIRARQSLARENLRLKQRIAVEKLRTEKIKQTLLSAAIPRPGEGRSLSEETLRQIEELYGLDTHRLHWTPEREAANQIEIRRHDILTGRIVEVKALPEKQVPSQAEETAPQLPQHESPKTPEGNPTAEKSQSS